MKFLRGLPPSWSGIALILKTKGGLEYISFDDLYNKLKFLEIDTKGYLSSSSTLSNAAFGSLKSKCSVVDDVIYSFFANHEIDQHLVYEDLDQMNKEEFEEYDLKHQMAMLSIKFLSDLLEQPTIYSTIQMRDGDLILQEKLNQVVMEKMKDARSERRASTWDTEWKEGR
nr:hypothetical protein [Tanacetum cinerariifolium]